MTLATSQIDTEIEGTEAFQELFSAPRAQGRQDSCGSARPPRARGRPFAGMAYADRCDGRHRAAPGVDPTGQTSSRDEAYRWQTARRICHDASRKRGATLSHTFAWDRSDRVSLQLSRFSQKLSRLMQACLGCLGASPCPSAALAPGTQGARMEQSPGAKRPLLGTHPPTHRDWRLVGTNPLEGRLRGRQEAIVPICKSRSLVRPKH